MVYSCCELVDIGRSTTRIDRLKRVHDQDIQSMMLYTSRASIRQCCACGPRWCPNCLPTRRVGSASRSSQSSRYQVECPNAGSTEGHTTRNKYTPTNKQYTQQHRGRGEQEKKMRRETGSRKGLSMVTNQYRLRRVNNLNHRGWICVPRWP